MATKYEIVAGALRRKAVSLRPGERLPSVREIGKAEDCSVFTAHRALSLLEEEGYVVRRPSMGFYAARPRQADPVSRLPT